MSTVSSPDRLSYRQATGEKAEVASAASTAAVVLRALLEDPDVLVGPMLRRETAQVLQWLDMLGSFFDDGAVPQLVDETSVTIERFIPTRLIARALTAHEPLRGSVSEPMTARAVATDRPEIALPEGAQRVLKAMIDARKGLAIQGEAIRVLDAKKVSDLADSLEGVATALVDDAYGMDRERARQLSIA